MKQLNGIRIDMVYHDSTEQLGTMAVSYELNGMSTVEMVDFFYEPLGNYLKTFIDIAEATVYREYLKTESDRAILLHRLQNKIVEEVYGRYKK